MKAEAVWLKYEKVLLRCFLFSGFDAPRLSRVLSGRGEVLSFDAGQAIFSPHCFKRAVGIFLQGKAQAEKFAEGRTVVLNRFEPPMMFGAAAVFRQAQEYVTQVTAKTRCRVLFLTDEELDAEIESNAGSLGYDDVEYPMWRGVIGAKNMSDEAVAFWADAFKKVSETEEWQKNYLERNLLVSQYMGPEEASAVMYEAQAAAQAQN